jgi:hypothetical protein
MLAKPVLSERKKNSLSRHHSLCDLYFSEESSLNVQRLSLSSPLPCCSGHGDSGISRTFELSWPSSERGALLVSTNGSYFLYMMVDLTSY